MKPPTARQLELVRIIAIENAQGRSPSFKEMARALRVSSTNAVTDMLGYLEARELIAPRRKHVARDLRVTEAGRAALAAAGDAVERPPPTPAGAIAAEHAELALARAAFHAGAAIGVAAAHPTARLRARAVYVVSAELDRAFATWWAARREPG